MQFVMVKFWAVALLLCLATPAFGDTAGDTQSAETTPTVAATSTQPQENRKSRPYTWFDSSHAYATDQAQALTEWMDSFFRDPNYEFEQPESRLRLQWSAGWDEMTEENTQLRLRGKLQLPGLSRRLGLVFSGEDSSQPGANDEDNGSVVALQYVVGENQGSRLDATLSVSSITPGLRYRYQNSLTANTTYRYTQRLEWEQDEGFHATSRGDFYYRLADDAQIIWSNRAIYGEETDGTEWRSRLSLRDRITKEGSDQPFVISYFGVIRGTTDPDLTKAWTLGVQLRRQIYRRFLFAELEPAYSWRKQNPEDDRDGGWRIVIRFEIALERDLMRLKPKKKP